MRILVIDDDAGVRDILAHCLGAQGHEVQLAGNGTEGVEMYLTHAPDIVLLDMLMPDMDGREAARRIRAVGDAWVPIIFLSGCDATEDIQTAIDAGGDDYIVKPFDLRLLETKIHAMQRIADMRRKLVEQAAELARLAEMDGLTGIPNRRLLDRKLREETSRCARSHLPLSVIMIDIDHFKRFNDTHGHQAGDECLKLVARTLSAQLHRPSDLVARYGGEEFCVVMPETPPTAALGIAEQLRLAVSRLTLETEQGEARMTISVGLASAVPAKEAPPEALVKQADQALYEAKKGGRNAVRSAATAKNASAPDTASGRATPTETVFSRDSTDIAALDADLAGQRATPASPSY